MWFFIIQKWVKFKVVICFFICSIPNHFLFSYRKFVFRKLWIVRKLLNWIGKIGNLYRVLSNSYQLNFLVPFCIFYLFYFVFIFANFCSSWGKNGERKIRLMILWAKFPPWCRWVPIGPIDLKQNLKRKSSVSFFVFKKNQKRAEKWLQRVRIEEY